MIHKINLKKIWIKSDDDVVVTKNSLFSTLLALKKNYKCKFDFKMNEQSDIALAVRLASGYIIKLFVIRQNKDQEFEAIEPQWENEPRFEGPSFEFEYPD